MKTPHTSTYRGKRVYVRLKTGDRFVDKFIDKKGKFVIFENRIVHVASIKAFAIFR